jgi:hypothetical protein
MAKYQNNCAISFSVRYAQDIYTIIFQCALTRPFPDWCLAGLDAMEDLLVWRKDQTPLPKVSRHNYRRIGVQVTLLHHRMQGTLQGCPRVGEIWVRTSNYIVWRDWQKWECICNLQLIAISKCNVYTDNVNLWKTKSGSGKINIHCRSNKFKSIIMYCLNHQFICIYKSKLL